MAIPVDQICSGEQVQGMYSKPRELRKELDEVVIFRHVKYMILEVFESLGLTGYELNVNWLDVRADKPWASTGPAVQCSAVVLIMLTGNSMFEHFTEDIADSVGRMLETAYEVAKNHIRNDHDALAKFLDVLLATETLNGDCYFHVPKGSLHFKQWDIGGCSLAHWKDQPDLNATWEDATVIVEVLSKFNL